MSAEIFDAQSNRNMLISRRTFLSGVAVVGALHFVGSFASPGGVTMAYADDAGKTHFKIYVLNREQVPIIAVNVRNGENAPVENMKITLRSCVTDQSISVVTDSFGCAVANIRALADNANEDAADSYGAWMRVEGELDGWQRFIETKRLVESGVRADSEGNMPNTIHVPTMPDTVSPYVSCLCLDGVDVKYLPQSVGLNAAIDSTHTIEVRVEHTESYENKWRFALVRRNGEDKPITEYVYATAQNNAVEAVLSGVWLDGNHGISAGDEIQLSYSPVDNGLMGLLTLPLTFENIELPMPGLEEELKVSPGAEPSKDNKSNMGSFFSWFVCTNDSLNMGIPYVPMEIFIDVYGNLGISAVLDTCTLYKYKDGKGGKVPKEERWKNFVDNSGKTGWLPKFKEELCDNAERWLDTAMDGDSGSLKAFGASPVTSKFTIAFSEELQGYGSLTKTEGKPNHYHGDMAIIGRFALNYMAAQQLTVAYIPVYWMFDFKAQALFKLLSGIQFDQGFKNLEFGHELVGKYNCRYAIVFFLEVEAGFTVGVGVMGIVSVGIRGYANFTLTASSDTSGGGEGAISPHISINAKANIQLALQLLLFKKTINLTHWGPWKLYDNWDDEAIATKLNGSNDLPGNRFGIVGDPTIELQTAPTACNDFEQVSEASLAVCAEFQGAMNSFGIVSYGANTAGNPSLKTSKGGSSFLKVLDGDDAGIRDPYEGALPVADIGSPFGAEGYNPLRGVRPSTQTLLWQDVFSAPRAKVVQAGAETYLLRISTVTIEVEDSNENLQLVEDSKGHVFARPKAGNNLPSVKLNKAGDALEYPDLGPDVCVARIGSFESGYEVGEHDEQGQLRSDTPESLAGLVQALNEDSSDVLSSAKPANTQFVTRSRLILSRYIDGGWREPQVIDFVLPATTAGYLRANTWDVDFDAVGYWNDTYNKYRIYILLSSIVRVVDDVTFEEQFKNQFITLLSYNVWDQELEFAFSNLSDYVEGNVCWHPRITVAQRDFEYEGQTESFDDVGIFYYNSKIDSSGTIDYSDTYMKFACWEYEANSEEHKRRRIGSGPVDIYFDNQYLCSHLAEGTFEVRNRLLNNNINHNMYAIGWHAPAQPADAEAGIEGHPSAAFFWTADAQLATCQGYQRIDGIEHCTIGTTSWSQPMETQWFYTMASENGGDRLLRRLKMIAVPYDEGRGARVSFSSDWPIGQIANAQGYFCNKNASRLYAVRSMEGTAPEVEDFAKNAIDNGALVCGTYSALNSRQAEHLSIANGEEAEIKQYQLLCAHYDYQNGTYHDFFPLAELDFAPDYSIPLNLETGNFDFLMGTITNLDNNEMSIYQVAIPSVLGLQLEGASAVSHFAMPGDVIKCQVRVTNTGNTPIVGFDATLWDDALQEPLDVISVTNLAGAVQFSEDMICPVYTSEGMPTDEYEQKEDILDQSGILWPGKTRCYHVKFTLPKTLTEEEHSFHITVSNPNGELSMLVNPEAANNLQAVNDGALCMAVDPRARRVSVNLEADGLVETNRIEPESSSIFEQGGETSSTGDSVGVMATAALTAAAAAAAGLAAAGSQMREELSPDEAL